MDKNQPCCDNCGHSRKPAGRKPDKELGPKVHCRRFPRSVIKKPGDVCGEHPVLYRKYYGQRNRGTAPSSGYIPG